MGAVIILIQIILVSIFVLSISMKLLRTKSMVHHWNEYRYPMWFMNVIILLELVGVIGLIIGFWIPEYLKFSGVLYTVLMLGALHAHFIRAKHKPIMAVNAIVMLILSIVIIIF
ncbi:DoxX family protein [Metabacillus niabensis]|uniref:DoxX family protein n=1 Tax=Metabacillus niabensis TaxID=324854 RepID=UPI001CF975A7|nr:DoxX family protein [Metabacillus niabensis]